MPLLAMFARLLCAAPLSFATSVDAAANGRIIEFQYQMLAGGLPSHQAVDIYLPVPADSESQQTLSQTQGSARAPLNYFIYPYVEVGGVPWQVKRQTRFSYREIEAGAAAPASDL